MPKKPKPPAQPQPPKPTPAQMITATALFSTFRGAYSREGGYDIDVADIAEMVAQVEEPLQRRIADLEESMALAQRVMTYVNQQLGGDDRTVTSTVNTPADFVLRSLRKAVEIRSRTPDPRGSDMISARTDVSVELLAPSVRSQMPPERLTVTVLAAFYGGHVDRWHVGISVPAGHLQSIVTGTDEAGLRACFGAS